MRIFRTNTILTAWRIILLYIVLMLCRVVFYIYNTALIGPLPQDEWWSLLCGSLKFDTVSILYANAVFILLSMVPLRLREKGWWQAVMYWYYVVVNTLLIVVVNMADAIYFRYTQKRFSADEIFFADNDNSLQLIFTFAAENWHIVFSGLALIALLVVGYCRKVKVENLFAGVWYYAVGVVMFALSITAPLASFSSKSTEISRSSFLANISVLTQKPSE